MKCEYCFKMYDFGGEIVCDICNVNKGVCFECLIKFVDILRVDKSYEEDFIICLMCNRDKNIGRILDDIG